MKLPVDDFVSNIAAKLPDRVRDKHLIEAGLFPSNSAISKARDRGATPPYFRVTSKQLFYLKSDVLAWLRGRYSEK